jgi:16S rRNA (guanine(966)-N(2))-methyltransferase RsmD
MRVIAGNYKGRNLRTLSGLDVRPTSDRLRETIFNILAPYIADASFLDICSGSGAVAIEALSRGAKDATLIESSRKAAQIIYENIERCQISKTQINVLCMDASNAIKHLSKSNFVFDIVYFDPPYKSDVYLPVLSFLGDSSLLAENAILIAEHHSKIPLPELIGKLSCYRKLKQGETQLSFYEIKI